MKSTILTTLLTFALLAMANLAFAQQEVVQDFESSPAIAGFEGLESATTVSDPSAAGNGQVFELVTSAAGNSWQGAEVVLADDSALDLTSDLTVSVDVWSDVAFSPMAKVETTGNADDAPAAANTQSHTGSGWETLTFTFNTGDDGTATADGIYNKVVFFPNRSADGTGWNDPITVGTFYFDNITGVKGSIGTTSTEQEVVQDFESSPPITGFEGLESATIIADPSDAGNGQVFELITSAGGNPWQGAEVVLADDSSLDLTSDLTISVDVWSDVAFSPMAKVETTEDADAAPFSANTQSHSGSGWETLTFTFNTGDDGTATADGIYNKVVFFPNRSADGTAWNDPVTVGTFYFDNITGVKGTLGSNEEEVAAPATAAPAQPLRDPADVISIFSDAYDDIEVGTFSAGFDDSSIEEVLIAGNPTKKITFNNFLGVDFSDNRIDASQMTHFHMDFWTEKENLDGAVFNSKFSQWDGTDEEVSAIEFNINTGTDPALESGTWISADFEIPSGASRDDIAQFIITVSNTLDVVYVDNIYLYREGTTTEATVDAFSLLSPADGTMLDLTGDGSDEAAITWEEATSNTDVTYTWHVDATGGDFSDPLVSLSSDNDGSATTLTLPFSTLDATLASLGVGEGESITVEWTVTAMGADVIQFADEVFSITLTRNLSVSNEVTESPNSFTLNQNYPNPFNPTTSITYAIPESGDVKLEVFNAVGQKVATLVNGVQNAGSHTVSFDASNLASGIYLYRLTSGNQVRINKMLLLK